MADVDPGTRLETLILRRKYDPKSREEKEVKVQSLKSDALSEEQRKELEHALVIRQIYDPNGQHQKTILNVNSPFILRAFRDVIKSHPVVPLPSRNPSSSKVHSRCWSITGMIWMFIANRHLTTMSDPTSTSSSTSWSPSWVPTTRDSRPCGKRAMFTYETLWSVFKPGSLLITFEDSHPWLLRCLRTGYEVYSTANAICHVYGEYTDFDGKTFGTTTQEFQIRQKVSLNGLHPGAINKLPIFPLVYWTKDEKKIDDLKRRLQVRGEAFKETDGVALRYYHGMAKYLREPPRSYYHASLEGSAGLWIGFTVSTQT